MYSVELKLMTSSVKCWNDACKKKKVTQIFQYTLIEHNLKHNSELHGEVD